MNWYGDVWVEPKSCQGPRSTLLMTCIEAYKSAMRHMVSTVTVITTRAGKEFAGMTVSSLASVSIRPAPVLSFNMQVPSRTAKILHDGGGKLAANILTPTRESILLARAFAGVGGHDQNPFFQHPELFDFTRSDGIPILKNSASTIICDVDSWIGVQDHEIIVARVAEVLERQKRALAYHDHDFHDVKSLFP